MSTSEPPRFLLLLPPAPSQPTPSALKTAYGDTLSQVLKEVATHSSDSPRAAILEIALALPHLVGQENAPRGSLFASTQSIIAGVYGLVTRIAAKDGIDVEDYDGVDVRIMLVSWSPEQTVTGDGSAYGPVISLEMLAKSGRPWQYAFGVESEEGEAFVKAFVEAKGSGEEVSQVQSGSTQSSKQPQHSQSNTSSTAASAQSTRHNHIAIGGTFDHIHIGHKLLLTLTAFILDPPSPSSSRRSSTAEPHESHTITIGITGDQLLKNKKHAEVLESWHDRYLSVMTFLDSILDFSPPSSPGQRHVSIRDDPGPNGKSMDVSYPNGLVIKCTEIQDPFGPTITDEGISAMVLTAETRSGGKAVNDKRAEKGWKALELFEVDVLDANAEQEGGVVKEGFESKLSSTSIREKLVKKKRGESSL